MWAVNGNQGNIYLFTADGFFVAELFRDVRVGKSWSMPIARRRMLLNDVSLSDENFWPGITQTKNGDVFICDGSRSSLVRVEGLETIRRLPATALNVSVDDLLGAMHHFQETELRRHK